MSEFEAILMMFMIPILLVLTYVAGKRDVLGLLMEAANEKAEEQPTKPDFSKHDSSFDYDYVPDGDSK